jgi:hypothetical protein
VLAGTTTTGGVVNVWAGTFPGPNGQIAFVRGPFEEHEFDEIYVMNAADGSDVTRLTDNDSNDFSPDWGTNTSPPGSGGTPAQAIDKLISTIQNLDDNVPQSIKTSLTAPLKGVSHILNDDNPNNDKAACGMLAAFTKLVNVNERLNMLTSDQADDLRTQAQDIMNALGC